MQVHVFTLAIITAALDIVLAAPNLIPEWTMYSEIISKCPQLRNDDNFKNDYAFSHCVNWHEITDLKSPKSVLCLYYFEAFVDYCMINSHRPIILSANILSNDLRNFTMNAICQDFHLDRNNVNSQFDFKLLNKPEYNCGNVCTDQVDDIMYICSLTHYYKQLTKSIYIQPTVDNNPDKVTNTNVTSEVKSDKNGNLNVGQQSNVPKVKSPDNDTPIGIVSKNVSNNEHNSANTEIQDKNAAGKTNLINLGKKEKMPDSANTVNTANAHARKVSKTTTNHISNEQKEILSNNKNDNKNTSNVTHKILDTNENNQEGVNTGEIKANQIVSPKIEPVLNENEPNNEVQTNVDDDMPVGNSDDIPAYVEKSSAANAKNKAPLKITTENNENKAENADVNPNRMIDLPNPDAVNPEENENENKMEWKTNEVKTPGNQPISDKLDEAVNYTSEMEGDSYFFSYFMVLCLIFVLGYVGYHNKQKILALALEGKKGKRQYRSRRPNSASYHKLDTNLEEAISSSCTKNTTNVIY